MRLFQRHPQKCKGDDEDHLTTKKAATTVAARYTPFGAALVVRAFVPVGMAIGLHLHLDVLVIFLAPLLNPLVVAVIMLVVVVVAKVAGAEMEVDAEMAVLVIGLSCGSGRSKAERHGSGGGDCNHGLAQHHGSPLQKKGQRGQEGRVAPLWLAQTERGMNELAQQFLHHPARLAHVDLAGVFGF